MIESAEPEPDPEGIAELRGHEAGRWTVHTRSGSRYLFDLDRRTVNRLPGPTAPPTINDVERPLQELVTCRVGQPGYWTMKTDDPLIIDYWQLTSAIETILQGWTTDE